MHSNVWGIDLNTADPKDALREAIRQVLTPATQFSHHPRDLIFSMEGNTLHIRWGDLAPIYSIDCLQHRPDEDREFNGLWCAYFVIANNPGPRQDICS